jgi:hypothetical protein
MAQVRAAAKSLIYTIYIYIYIYIYMTCEVDGFQVSMAQVRAAAKSLIYTRYIYIYIYMTCEVDGFQVSMAQVRAAAKSRDARKLNALLTKVFSLSIYLSIHPSIHPSIFLFIYLHSIHCILYYISSQEARCPQAQRPPQQVYVYVYTLCNACIYAHIC